ncbi:hypothetical protein [Mesorhizobium helmanticense]|uniref:SRPBCC family protein n=1 Tax=Mesorhizobium helmanticense TaxID=1776423 RepID=A0A2T4ILZ6_9HYPH|nr:hypothetical protein [Mesorhizobium helmanticense]PTE06656.1 hypothetical protein C9427_30480 [Mesorhizobium helmanticense]
MRDLCITHPVAADPASIMDAIWSGAEWQARWTPIHSFAVRYDDGLHQAAEIVLDWEGRQTQMQVVRFRTHPLRIDFFCPRPPDPLVHQSGRWAVETVQGTNVVVASRRITLAQLSGEEEAAFQLRLDSYAERLSQRLTLILSHFAGVSA